MARGYRISRDMVQRDQVAAWRMAKAAGRFVGGRPLDGRGDRTDATWVHRGTKSYGDKRANWWHYRSRFERVGARLAGVGAAVGLGWSAYEDWAATLDGLHVGGVGAASAGTAFLGYKAADQTLALRHHHDWVWPLHVALAEHLRLPEGTRPRHYLHVPRDFNEREGETGVAVKLPASFIGEDVIKQAVTRSIQTKLAMQDITFNWQLTSTEHHVTVRATPRPPDVVKYSDPETRKQLESMPENSPMIGVSHSGRVVAVNLDSEAPHILISMSTGGGKSTILKALAAQFIRNGAIVVVLDFKRHSHKWIKDLPGVVYCRAIEEIDAKLVELGKEGERRNEIIEQWEGKDKDAPVGPRIVILFEEANATIRKLKKHWKKVKGKGDPEEGPAMEGFGDLLFMGRAVKMNILLVAQSATANALGGPEVRECFSTRILARYTKNAWNMLVPEAGPPPRKINHLGRCQVVKDGTTPWETQVLLFEDHEAREFALSGTRTTAQAGPPTTPAPAPATNPPVTGHGPLPTLGASAETTVLDPEDLGLNTPAAAASHEPSHAHTHTGSQWAHPGESPATPHTGDHVSEPAEDPVIRRYGRFGVIEGQGQGGPAPDEELDHADGHDEPPVTTETGDQDTAAPEPRQYTMKEASQDEGEGIIPRTYEAIRRARSDRAKNGFPPEDGWRGSSPTWYAETLIRWDRNRPFAASSGE